MFVVDRCLTSTSLAILCSETMTTYLLLEIVVAILSFHKENRMLLHISIQALRTPSPSAFQRAPKMSTTRWFGNSPNPIYIKSFNSQKWPVHPKSRCWLSQQPRCLQITQAIPIHQTVLQTEIDDVFIYGLQSTRKSSFALLSTSQHLVCYK